ncbi:MAG TPA: pitrilysin family protein [Patescibacteria group bacterium]|nr:pitrilysin family protein [Patescibacteria group bacterium]
MYYTEKLSNGIEVMVIPQHETQAASVMMMVNVGSREENSKNTGVSHFIEHLLFKGTKKYPNTEILSRTLDSVGAEFNAYTSKDHTAYYIKIQHEKLPLAFDVLSDMLYNPLFAAEEIERERGVILEEINMYEDNPIMSSEDLFEQTLFHDGTCLGRQIIGTKKSIAGMTREIILAYQKNWYLPQHVLLVVSGKVPEKEQLKKNIEKMFSKGTLKGRRLHRASYTGTHSKPCVAVKFKDTEQVHIVLGVPGISYAHKDRFALAVANRILGGGMSSRLFINIRERQGLCYYIRSSADSYADAGAWYVRAGLDKSRIHEAITLILKELNRLKTKGVTAKELQEAKDGVRGSTMLQLEDSLSIAQFFGTRKLLTNEIKTPEEVLSAIDGVTIAGIERISGVLLKENKLHLAIIGPFEDAKPFTSLLKL